MEDIKKISDAMRGGADILDELIELRKREQSGENVQDKVEALLKRLIIKIAVLREITLLT